MKRKAMQFIFLILCGFWHPQTSLAGPSDLVISEIMYDAQGADTAKEWVEFYNASTEAIEILTGSGNQTWRFWDGANHLLSLVNGTSTITSSEYFIIAGDASAFLVEHPGFVGTVFDTSMNLVNSSSTVAISVDGGNNQIISANYDSAWGASGDGKTLEKIILNQDSSQTNWQVSSNTGGTPGQSNSQAIVGGTGDGVGDNHDDSSDDDSGDNNDNGDEGGDDESAPTSSGSSSESSWTQIYISEILPNPKGSDEAEWIELYNGSSQAVDLSGFKLQDNSARVFTLSEDVSTNLNLNADSYLLLPKSLTGISLNNTGGDSVKLYSTSGALLHSVSYADIALENKSYARQNNDFVWTSSLTPGLVNIIVANLAPQAKIVILSKDLLVGEKIIVSAEESSDPEEGKLNYWWDFGDDTTADEKKENHVYAGAGSYLLRLKVTDTAGLYSEATKLIEVLAKDVDIKIEDIAPIDFAKTDLLITEFLADPIGSDEAEWIELYNASAKNISLAGWQLDDVEGGSKPYIFNASSSINAGEFLLISRSESKIALNNQNDAVRILTPLGEVWQTVSYEQSKEGQSQAWDLINQEWFWTENPSPQALNIVPADSISLSLAGVNFEDKQLVSIQVVVLNPSSTSTRSIFVAPLNFDQTIDYENILETYNSKKLWPNLSRGDVVNISGQVNNKYTPVRIKINQASDITKLQQPLDIITPNVWEIADINDEHLNSYLTLHAWVVKKSGSNLYLAESTGDDSKVRASLSFSSQDMNLKKGAEIIVTGVLGLVDGNYKLFVLSSEDLKLSQTVLGEKITSEISTSTHNLASADRINSVKNILRYIIVAIVVVLIILFLKKRQT